MHRGLLLVACALAAGCASCSDRASPPNILLISIDSLRPDHLSCYGYERPTSPTIDALAASGVRFDSAVSTTSWTLPAHAALFTGLFDSTHGLFDNGLRLSQELPTLAGELRTLGYHTAGFFGGPYLHPTFGLGAGFEHYESCMTAVPGDLSEDELRQESRSAVGRSHDDITGPRTLEAVGAWSTARPTDRPYFLFVHLWDVHYDFIPPPPFDTLFDPDYGGSLDGRGFMSRPEVHAKMEPRDLQHLKALYDGEIRFTDDVLGQLLARLRAQGALENTLIVVTADHGEEFFEHGGKGHQKTLFDEVLRIPLILNWEGVLDGPRVVADQVRIVDLMPSLLRAAGAKSLPTMQGRDILPLARGERLAPAPALAELHADKRDFRALRTLDFKVIDYGRAPDGRALPIQGFDLGRDPSEMQPLRPGGGTRVDALHAELERSREAALALRKYLGARAQHTAIDAELERKLRETGYLGETAKDK